MTGRQVIVGLGLGLGVAAASGAPAQAPALRPATAEHASVSLAPAPTPATTGYTRRGRRDPFEPLEGAQGVGLVVASAKLRGIVRGGVTRALIETPDGVGYIMKPGDTLGDGRLLEIGADSVVFRVPPRRGATTDLVVLRLSGG